LVKGARKKALLACVGGLDGGAREHSTQCAKKALLGCWREHSTQCVKKRFKFSISCIFPRGVVWNLPTCDVTRVVTEFMVSAMVWNLPTCDVERSA
jgi:hypothetical protein